MFSVFAGSTFAQKNTTGGQAPGNTTGGKAPDQTLNFTLDNPFKHGDNLYDLLKAIINQIILPIGGVLAVLAFIYAGFLYVSAQGDEKKIQTAHRALLYTAIGTAVLLGAWVIANVIENTINQLKP